MGTCQWDGNIFLEMNSTRLDAGAHALKQRHSREESSGVRGGNRDMGLKDRIQVHTDSQYCSSFSSE